MLIILYSLLGAAISAFVVYWYITRTFNYWKRRNVAGPTPVPLFGNIKDSATRRKNIGIVMKDIYDQYPNEKVVGVFRMTTPVLFLRDLDIIKQVMIKDFDLFSDRGVEISDDGLGQNLFNADGQTWRALRSKLTPIFTSGKLRNMFHLVTDCGDRFMKYADEVNSANNEVEVYDLVKHFTLASIASSAFGMDLDPRDPILNELIEINDLVLQVTYLQELDFMYPGVLKKIGSTFVPKRVSNFFFNLVKTIVKQRNGTPGSRNDFMDLLLELKKQGTIQGNKRAQDNDFSLELTDSVIAAQAFVFFVAGYETSATTMTFMLYELAKNQEVQDKLIAEIDEVLKKNNGDLTYDSLSEYSYLAMVMDETLRMYPLVEPLQRMTLQDYHIPGTDIELKKNTIVLVSPIAIHRDKKYYPNPEEFRPERFSSEESKNRHSCAYMPFGTGPRNCIGMRFAKVQTKVCIIKLFSKYRVERSFNTKEHIEFDPRKSIIGPTDGIQLKFVTR